MSIAPITSTLRDVARTAGVSETAVSHILHGKGRFSQSTRDRVLSVASAGGYRPNLSARAMVTGRFGTYAMLLANEGSHGRIHAGLLDGIQDALAAHGQHLLVERLPGDDAAETVPRLLAAVAADGYLVNWHVAVPEPLIQAIESMPVPAVWLNVDRPQNAVYPDDRTSARIATEGFLARGHRRIAYLSFNTHPGVGGSHYSHQDRYGGYIDAMTAAGLGLRALGPDEPHEQPREHRLAACRAWLSGLDRPTAILTYGENAVPYLIMAAHDLGLRLPQDLSVVTFAAGPTDGIGQTVAYMRVPFREVGQAAVDMLAEVIAHQGLPLPARAIPGILVDGQSLGPAPM